ncbi:hypothetical protein HYR54_04865 [Candidatus Acetothermia bacterium]|nr:hypothetical protein [Candidatus Acetothermia bacterium]
MRSLVLGCSLFFLLLAVLIVAASSDAAPISGVFQVDIVIHALTCGVDNDGDTFVDEDGPDGVDNDGDTLIDEDPCFKVDDTAMKLEVDLALQLTISGLQIGSTTVFTFKGVEYQAFTLAATIGALSIRDAFIFAPDIVEIEYVRTSRTLSLRYCINAAAPGDVTPPFFDCPKTDSLLYWLIEASAERFHPTVSNLKLAQIFDSKGMLDPILIFRKKIVELSLNIAGLTFSTRAMFANLGTAAAPSYTMGFIAAAEGQTVSGVTVRAESWIGARQGLECFGECKPVERLYGGKVISGAECPGGNCFTIQEEKLFIRNLTLVGVNFNVRAEFIFFSDPNYKACPNSGICFVEIQSQGKVSPLNLSFTNELRLDGTLNPRFDELTTTVKFGDVSVTIEWLFYPQAIPCGFSLSCPWEAQVAEIISTFDPPGLTVTSELQFCTERLFSVLCGFGGVLQHDIYLSAKVGNFTWDARFIFLGLISNFFQLWVDTSWKAGEVTFTNSIVLATDAVEALAFGIRVRF